MSVFLYLCQNNQGKMKKFIYILLALMVLPSCHKKIWDMLNDHEARITRLEIFCNQLNTNINSLQAIVDVINARDYVKDITPVMEDGTVIGYTLSFNAHNPITIYNGKNGEDGHTPLIGIKKDSDDIWYWTLDGEWILDADGKKVSAGGGNGVTPLLKIEEDYWWVSYDNGTSWTKLEKAVGEKGESGDSMIKEIRQDNAYVYIVLADGEEIKISKGGGLTWVYV